METTAQTEQTAQPRRGRRAAAATAETPKTSKPRAARTPAEPKPSEPKPEAKPKMTSFNMSPLSEIKKFREGTKRATVIGMLVNEGGATFAEVMEATGWDHKTAYEGVRLINLYVGYGLRTDAETGKISAYEG